MSQKKIFAILTLCVMVVACQSTESTKNTFRTKFLKAQNEPTAELTIPNQIKTDIKLTSYHHKVIREAKPESIIEQKPLLDLMAYDEQTQNTINLVEKLRNHQFDQLNAKLGQLQQAFEENQSKENEQTLFEAYACFKLAFIQDLEHFNKWVEHSTTYALMARATYLHNFSWLIRGNSYAYKINKGNLDTSRHLAIMAQADAFTVLAANPNNLPMLEMINRSSRVTGWYLRHNWFYGAAEKYPNSVRLINTYASSIITRWGGRQVQRDHLLNYLTERAPWALPKVIETFNHYEINTDTKEPLLEAGYYDNFLPKNLDLPLNIVESDHNGTYARILKPKVYYKKMINHSKKRELDQCLAVGKLSFYFGHVTGETLIATARCHSKAKNYQKALEVSDIHKKLFPTVMPINRSRLQLFLKKHIKHQQDKAI